MSAEHWQRISAIFEAVVTAPAADRQKILDEACRADPALRAEISALLAAHDAPTTFLDRSPDNLLAAGLEPGTFLCDRFVVLRLLGVGGMGEVWSAMDRHLDEAVAIKVIHPLITGDAVVLARFKRELQLARRIAHPNVCRVHELFEDVTGDRHRFFLTMELLQGETLAMRLKRDGRIPRDEALTLVNQIVSGLSAAHAAGIVHRDLKPSNIMLTPSASRRIVIMDFGLARGLEGSLSTETSESVTKLVVGTPEYMAPEQISGGVPTQQTDIYALGLTLFEMLRGERPFAGTTTLESWMRRARETPARLSGVVPGVERRIDDVIARCLEYDPGRRFRSVDDVWSALHRKPALPLRGRWPARVAVATVVIATLIGAWQLQARRRALTVPSAEAIRWYVDAQQALAEGATVRALNNINRSVATTPAYAPARAALAEILLELDMPGRAQEAMLLATTPGVQTAASNDDPYVNGVRELLLQQCDAAVASFQRHAQAALPDERPYRLLTVSRALERCGRPDDAQKILAQAAAVDPRNAAVAVRQARLYARQRQFATAGEALDRAEMLFRDRNNIEGVCEALVTRGTLEAEQDLLERATATLGKAADIAQSLDDVRQQVRIRLQQAIVRRKQGDVATANRLTAEATEIARRQNLETLTLEGLFAAGNVQLVRNQHADAQALFERGLAVAENNRHEEYTARAWLSLATLFVRVMEPDKAEKAVQTARPYYERVKQTRNLANAAALLGQIRVMRAEYPAAIKQFEAELAVAERSGAREQETSARENLATVLVAVGRYSEAMDQYRVALTAHRSSGRQRNEAFALLNIADIHSQLGQFQEAAAALKEANALSAGAAEIEAQWLVVRAAAGLREGRYRAAWTDATNAVVVGGELSTVRTARARGLACAAGAALRHGEAASNCAAARDASPFSRHVPLWLEVRLYDAEAQLRLGNTAGVADGLDQALRVIETAEASADRWRALALAAAARVGPPRAEAQASLTRELETLRLVWGEPMYQSWRRRSDVEALLKMAGF